MTLRSADNAGAWAKRRGRQRLEGGLVSSFLLLCATITVLTTAGIVIVLGVETVRFFQLSGVGLGEFLLGHEIDFPDAADGKHVRFGILALIWGTFLVAGGACLIALPIGLVSAIYLSEYAPRRLRSVLKPTLELLAGVPTIVYGYLALLLVTPALRVVLAPLGLRLQTFNALSACIVVGVMIIPMVSSLSEDVLSAVPARAAGRRRTGWGRRSSRSRRGSCCPAALSGVAASFILAVSRAIGETMAVVLAAGNAAELRSR